MPLNNFPCILEYAGENNKRWRNLFQSIEEIFKLRQKPEQLDDSEENRSESQVSREV